MTVSRRPRRHLGFLVVLGSLWGAAGASAATITIDGGSCTLADAIRSANTDTVPPFSNCVEGDGDDVIVLGVTTTISAVDAAAAGSSVLHGGVAGLPDVVSTITIQAGVANTISRDLSLACGPAPPSPFRLFNVLNGGALTLEGVTLRNGCIAPTAPIEGRGGAISVNFGTLTVIGGSFLDNRVRGGNGTGMAGSAASGGAVAVSLSAAELTVVDALFEGNTARGGDSDANGGAAAAVGGAIDIEFATALTITGSEFRANKAIGGNCSDPSGCTGANGAARGGALAVGETPFAVADTIFAANQAAGGNANLGNAEGGAMVLFDATGTLERLVLTDNDALGGPGSVLGGGAGIGGALYVSNSTPTIRGSLFRGNLARGGVGALSSGAGRGGAIYWTGNAGEITGCTLLDNAAEGAPGATASEASGGALSVVGPLPLLANSTLVGNVARGGNRPGGTGGMAFGGAIATNANVTAASHLTISGNDAIGGGGATGGAAEGGGIHVDFNDLRLDNSVLAGNRATPGGGGAVGEDCFLSGGTFTSAGYNFVQASDASCTFTGPGDQTGDPLLLPISEFGCAAPLPDGTCPPLAPLPATSPAIDAGDCTVSGLTTDQRGAPRPAAGACDPGAFELVPGAFHAVTPCRLVDTRVLAEGPALASGASRVVQVVGPCNIGLLATAVAVNATVTGPTGAGHLTLFPGDGAVPATSTLNFSAGQTRANNAVLPLATDGAGTLAAQAAVTGAGSVHLILDVTGWFE